MGKDITKATSQAGRLPKKVGPYEVRGRLGKGGMGEVLLATHELLGRDVALKRLKLSKAFRDDADALRLDERFVREGALLAKLHHEGICTVYDLFTHRGGLFMALEVVDGYDLQFLLSEGGPLPVDVVAILGVRLADALDHAHRAGVVHRDIKPANVMISRAGEVKLMDFGIARAADLDKLTGTGLLFGTPAYMAPELFRGAAADPRSDIYATGALLYFCLSGRTPFRETEPEALTAAILGGRVVPLRKVAKVPRALARTVMRCLHADRDRRFASAAHLRQALDGFIARRVDRPHHAARLVEVMLADGHLPEHQALTVVDRQTEPPRRVRPLRWSPGAALVVWLVLAALTAGALGATLWWEGVDLGALVPLR